MTASSRSEAAPARDPTSARAAWWVAGIGLVFALGCAVSASSSGPVQLESPDVSRGVVFPLVVLTAAFGLAALVALRRNRPRPVGPWVFIVALGALALVAETVRRLLPFVSDGEAIPGTTCVRNCRGMGYPNGRGGFEVWLGDPLSFPQHHDLTVRWFGTKLVFPVSSAALTVGRVAGWLLPLVGGCCLLFGVHRIFRARCSGSGRRLGLDIALVVAVAGLLAWSLLLEPARDNGTLSNPSFVAVPVVDFVAAWFLLLVALTMRRRLPAVRLLSASVALHLGASIMTWYALNFDASANVVPNYIDNFWFRAAIGVYIASAALLAAAALHPSMRELGRPEQSDAVPQDAMRYQLLVGLGLCAVAVDTIVRPLAYQPSRVLVGVASVALVTVVLQRAWRSTTAQLTADRNVRELNDTLSSTLGRLATAESDERRRIARDLHDTVVQDLVALRWQFAELAAGSDLASAAPSLAGLSERLVEITQTARSVSHRLEAPVRDNSSLNAALRSEVLALRSAQLDIDLRCRFDRDISGDAAALAFRTIREALRNVVRHADASHASVVITTNDEWLEAEVRDDGIGIGPDELETRAQEGHIGVASMRDGIAAAGGTFEIVSAAARGTTVRFTLRLGPSENAAAPRAPGELRHPRVHCMQPERDVLSRDDRAPSIEAL